MNKNLFVRSPLNHLGNKFRILDQIFKHLPKDNDYIFVDVFGGSFNVGINSPYKKLIYNEKDKNLFEIIKFLSKNNFEIINKLITKELNKFSLFYNKEYKKNKEKYLMLREEYNKNKNLVLLIILVFFSFNSEIRFNKDNLFNVPIGKSGYTEFRKNNLKSYNNKIKEKDVLYFNEDFEKIVEKIISTFDNKIIFFYFDPPYLISKATYNSNWNIEEEKRLIKLLEKINSKNIKFLLSNFLENGEQKNSILYNFIKENNLFIKEIKSNYKNSNYQRKEKQTKEILVWNYEYK
ncbi:Dam family site-specific DNA-(adenine-N6)-methyltransferase [Mycoplasma sp. 5370]